MSEYLHVEKPFLDQLVAPGWSIIDQGQSFIPSDPANELAVITEARKEARRWSAVENFCKPFDFDDPDKVLTGVAF